MGYPTSQRIGDHLLTPGSVLALNNLFRFALMGLSDAPGPLSPHVYWVKDGRWEQVTQFVNDEPRVVVSEELAAVLGVGEQG